MKALVFAAGLGTRLRPLTEHTPKALVPVAGHPMLKRVILKLKAAGFDDITVNIHHLGQQIIDYLHAHGNFGITIHISDERDRLLDTGGGVLKARPFLDGNEPFLVHNADVLSDLDIKAFCQNHVESGATATLLVGQRQTSRYLLLDDNLRLHGWLNKSTGEVRPESLFSLDHMHEYAFGGIHVLSPAIFPLMEKAGREGAFPIIPFYLSVCREVRLQGYLPTGIHWFDIGRPETLAAAEAFLSANGI